MAERKQVEDLNTRSPLRPTASPVDNYYKVQADTVQLEGGGDFADLAKSVGIAVPMIQKELSEQEKAEQEKQIQEGAKARLANQKSFKQMQDRGEIAPGQNPWYWKGFMQQDGRIAALNYDEAMRTQYMTSEARNSDNPQELAKFMTDHRKQWLEENKGATPDWMDTFIPGIQKSENNLSAQHVAHRNQVLISTQEANTGIEISKILAAQRDREVAAGNDPDLIEASRPAVAKQISDLTADLVRKGMSGTKANEIIAEQVIARGVEDKDQNYARGLLENISTGSGKVSDITGIKAKIESAENHIRSVKRQEKLDAYRDEDRPFEVAQRNDQAVIREHRNKEWSEQQKSRDRDEKIRGFTSDISNQIRINGVIDPNKLALLRKEDWRAAAQMEDYQHTRQMRGEQIIPDQQVAARMSERIATNPDSVREHDIWAGVRQGGWTYEQAKGMSNELQERLKSPANSILKTNQGYKDLESSGASAIAKNMETARTGAGEATAGLFKIRWRKINEDIWSDTKTTPGQKEVLMEEAYLKELTRSNSIAAGLMQNSGGDTLGPPKPTVAQKKQQTQTNAESAIQADEAKWIPAHHIQRLIENYNDPDARATFDKKYGPGAAEMVGIGGSSGRYLKERGK